MDVRLRFVRSVVYREHSRGLTVDVDVAEVQHIAAISNQLALETKRLGEPFSSEFDLENFKRILLDLQTTDLSGVDRSSELDGDLYRENLLNEADVNRIEREWNGFCLSSFDDKGGFRAAEGTRAVLGTQQSGALLAGVFKRHVSPSTLSRNDATELETPGSVLGHIDALHRNDVLSRR